MLVPVRAEDVPLGKDFDLDSSVVKPAKSRMDEKKFNKEASVFKDWKQDSYEVLEKCGA